MSKNILLIGETCLDAFVIGKCPRIAPEGPVPVFLPQRIDTNPGMAANVLANLKSLAPDFQVDFIHQDTPIQKIRYVDEQSGQQIMRMDIGDADVQPILFESLWNRVSKRVNDDGIRYDAVVISEYKGFISTSDIAALSKWAKDSNIPVFCDTKHLIGDWAKNVTVIKINRKEADAHGCEPWPYCENLVITEGPDGCYLDQRDNPGVMHRVPVKSTEVRSVAGAGDSFMAGLVVSYLEQADEWTETAANGFPLEEHKRNRLLRAMAFANKVAAVAVSKRGVVAVKREEVE